MITDLKQHHYDMLTLGQYLQPSLHHLAVKRYLTPAEFDQLADFARNAGFKYVASGPMVRSSYFAEHQVYSSFIPTNKAWLSNAWFFYSKNKSASITSSNNNDCMPFERQ